MEPTAHRLAGGWWLVAGGRWLVAGGRWPVAGGRWLKGPPPLGWLAGILAVAVVALGAWLIVGSGSEGASLPAEVEGALDNYYAAWTGSDGAALIEATTEDFEFVDNGSVNSREVMPAALTMQGFFGLETSDRIVTGSGPYYVADTSTIQTSSVGESYLGVGMVRIVEVDGSWKVQRHVWIGENP